MDVYRQTLTAFTSEFGYPAEAQTALLETYEKIVSDPCRTQTLMELFVAYEEDCKMSFSRVLTTCKQLAEATKANVYTVNLVVLILLSEPAKKHYKAQGLGLQTWKDNFADLGYKLHECRLVKGSWGTFVPDWFFRFYDVSRFAFGKLQFETEPFHRAYNKNGVNLSKDSVVVNVHIPRTGKRLAPQDVDEACEMASRFFQERYGLTQIVFVCHSWLLYPENKKMLSPTSNLYSFISRFDIIESEEYTNYNEVWRLFDKEYTGNIDELPADSSFRRAYIERIRKGEKTGCGYGVFVYKR